MLFKTADTPLGAEFDAARRRYDGLHLAAFAIADAASSHRRLAALRLPRAPRRRHATPGRNRRGTRHRCVRGSQGGGRRDAGGPRAGAPSSDRSGRLAAALARPPQHRRALERALDCGRRYRGSRRPFRPVHRPFRSSRGGGGNLPHRARSRRLGSAQRRSLASALAAGGNPRAALHGRSHDRGRLARRRSPLHGNRGPFRSPRFRCQRPVRPPAQCPRPRRLDVC